jgi:hypothetical protein
MPRNKQNCLVSLVPLCYEGGVADGAMEVAGGGVSGDGGGACAPVVIFDEVKCGFTVFGIPHILDSVVLTGVSFADGLLGLHIASFCSGVNVLAFP